MSPCKRACVRSGKQCDRGSCPRVAGLHAAVVTRSTYQHPRGTTLREHVRPELKLLPWMLLFSFHQMRVRSRFGVLGDVELNWFFMARLPIREVVTGWLFTSCLCDSLRQGQLEIPQRLGWAALGLTFSEAGRLYNEDFPRLSEGIACGGVHLQCDLKTGRLASRGPCFRLWPLGRHCPIKSVCSRPKGKCRKSLMLSCGQSISV